MLYVYYCCNNSTDDFYEKVVCGGERPRLGPAPPAPLRALLRRCWSLQSDSRPSMPVILGHLAFITAEAEREKGGVAAGGAYYGEVCGYLYMYYYICIHVYLLLQCNRCA
jgi:hypothetical protein